MGGGGDGMWEILETEKVVNNFSRGKYKTKKRQIIPENVAQNTPTKQTFKRVQFFPTATKKLVPFRFSRGDEIMEKGERREWNAKRLKKYNTAATYIRKGWGVTEIKKKVC
eukprot:GEMP01042288.1.p1 GENE.GEMP01042288.1~~GEMP01042288.1.p1  ORF type:complete len:111 (-),score=3.04 GEMP01042288.1:492-824(-)